MKSIGILGAGSWGTALAVHLGRLDHDVRLWARDPVLAAEMAHRRINTVYLPETLLPASVSITHDVADAVRGREVVVSAIPSHGCRAVVREAAKTAASHAVFVSAAKGLEEDTLLRMSEVIAQEVGTGRPVVVLSGAIELVQAEFRGPFFRLYGSDDVIGVEIGAAMKNIIAIAAGVVEGLGLGHNALAALITRGLAEVSRIACAAGGRRETLAGLSGLGDLVLTCTGDLSRNRRVGIELAMGRTLTSIIEGTRMVAEGVRTTGAALALASRYGVELPIATQMAEVLAGRADVRAAISVLMLRPQRAEAEKTS